MKNTELPASIQATKDALVFHRREWLVQRLAWIVLTLVIVAALLGLFGEGPLSKVTHADGAGQFEYERFARRDAHTEWRFKPLVQPPDGRFTVAVDATLAENFRITEINPEPSSTSLVGAAWLFEFEVRDVTPIAVKFRLEPRGLGTLAGNVRVAQGKPVPVSIFVYP